MKIINRWSVVGLALTLAGSLAMTGAAWAQAQTGGGPGGQRNQALCTGDQCQVPGTGAGAKNPGKGNCPAGPAKAKGAQCPLSKGPKAAATPAPGPAENK